MRENMKDAFAFINSVLNCNYQTKKTSLSTHTQRRLCLYARIIHPLKSFVKYFFEIFADFFKKLAEI